MKNLKILSLTLIIALLANNLSSVALGKEKSETKTSFIHEKLENWKQENNKEETWFKAKDTFYDLPKAQQTALKEKLEKLKSENFLSSATQDLVQDFKKSKITVSQKLQRKNLSETEKETLKKELQNLRENLKNINEGIQKDFAKQVRKKLTEGEQSIIQSLEPTLLFELQDLFIPNDPDFSDQWGVQSLNLSTLLETLPSVSEKTIVAMIDAGVDFSHEDLNASQWTSETCVDENGDAISGGCLNGGYDFIDNDTDPYPTDSVAHGTGVASFIGAQTDNNVGMASASNNNVEIMALRSCCDVNGFMPSSNIEKAIRFAVNNGAQVINASFGGTTYSQEIYDALDYARENNVLVIAAAGNYATDNDTQPMYPANYDLENIISVGATTDWDGLAYFSNYGDETVDIAAPGQNVWGAGLNNSYGAMSGTSFSAPMVSSVVSLLVRGNTLSFSEIKNTLFSLVQALSSLDGNIINSRVLRFDAPETEPSPDSPESGLEDEGEEEITEPNPDPEESEPENPEEPPQTELSSSICGNGIVEGLEACDDGNTIDGDGCSAVCEVEELTSGSGVSITIPVSGSSVGSFIFHHEDHLTGGNVDTDESGAVVQLLDYYPFGDTRIDEHSVDYANDYKFTGKEKDEETGLYYYEARYYDSSLGRFASIDPWEGDLSDPQSLNKYSYVKNNPVKYRDPSGEVVETFWDAANVASDVFNIVGTSAIYGYAKISENSYLAGAAADGLKTIAGDLAVDAGATLIPGLPAGTSKVERTLNQVKKNGEDIVDMVRKKVDNSFDLPVGGKIKGYTKHGRERALIRDGRGVNPKSITESVENPQKIIKQSDGANKYQGKDTTTVLNKDGNVITTYGKPRHETPKKNTKSD